jgi:hypothetical protein
VPAIAVTPEAPSPRRRVGAPRTLTLTTPYTEGRDVVLVQRALGVADDGFYGPVTASAAAQWKYDAGYLVADCVPTLDPTDQARLLGVEPLPEPFVRRAGRRARSIESGRRVPELAAAEMERWVGLRERPTGSEYVPELSALAADLGLAEWYVRMGWPWCAFAVFLAALRHGGRTAAAGLRRGAFNALYCPTVLAEAQLGRHGMRVVPASQARRGDLVLFDWGPGGDPADHIGRLVAPPADGLAATVDGNSGEGSRFVALRERPLALVRAFVRDS